MTERIPREFIQQLLSRIDIVELIDNRVPLRKKTGQNFFACCPFHDEKSASFSVSQNKQFFYCFGCGAHGNAIDFLIQFDRLAFPEAIEALAKQCGMEVPRDKHNPQKTENYQEFYALMAEVAKFYQQQLRKHPQAERVIQYLKNRGMSGEIAKTFGLGFAPPGWDQVLQHFGDSDSHKQQLLATGMLIKKEDGGFYDRFRDRIMFPILDRQGRTIGFGGRIIDQGEPKYLNSPETPLFQKGHELYGIHQALQIHRQLQRIIIVEGYMDVIALFQLGITYAVATLGTATTASHLQKLFRYTSDIIFCFDGDNAGRTAAWRALQVTLPLMRDGIQVRFMFLPDGEDPDTLVRKEGKAVFEQRMQTAPHLADFFFQSLASQTDLTSVDGRARFVKLAKEHMDALQESMFRQMMFDELAKKARIPTKQLTTPPAAYSSRKASAPAKSRVTSALRLAMTLLVQHPELAKSIDEPIPAFEAPGFDLFKQLLSILEQQPNLTTGGLLEFWRDQTDSEVIAKLAQTEHMIPPDGIKNEFLGTIRLLRKLSQKQTIESLLARAAMAGLSEEEKLELNALIQDK